MYQTILQIDGMSCGMCEAHVNDKIRAEFQVKKVESSHKSGKTTVISAQPLEEEKLRRALEETGYHVGEITVQEYEKKRFSLFGRK